jgi:hypothetical protein
LCFDILAGNELKAWTSVQVKFTSLAIIGTKCTENHQLLVQVQEPTKPKLNLSMHVSLNRRHLTIPVYRKKATVQPGKNWPLHPKN